MLIKVEAINIDLFVGDTQNLSVIRGGSLMLLDMPGEFGAWLRREYGERSVSLIRSGASQAIFELEAAGNADEAARAAKEWLREHFPHATIGVAVAARPTGSYFAAFEELSMSIREQQMRSFSLAGLKERQAARVCAWDRLRTADCEIEAKKDRFWVSAATAARHSYGRNAKRDLLKELASQASIQEFESTDDLDELSGSDAQANLNHKIAVFYADGNSFGKELKCGLSRSPGDRQRRVIGGFDKRIQEKQNEFLSSLLKATEAHRWQTAEGKRRIEVLLRGGDELMLVVPAWCGWETAETFCQVMKNSKFCDGQVSIAMKYAMGLVFAHRKAPIHGLAKLARALVEEAKTDRKHNRLSYLVLESFDHVGENLGRFRAMRCPNEGTRQAMALNAEEDALERLREEASKLKTSGFPRRKVFQAALGLASDREWGAIMKDLKACLNDERWKKPLDEWIKLAGGEQAAWYHLADLWDFVGVEA